MSEDDYEDGYATVKLTRKDVCDLGFAIGYVEGKEILTKGTAESESFRDIAETLKRIADKIEYLMSKSPYD